MSLLWVQAVAPTRYVTHQELGQMYSGDFDEPFHRVRKSLQEDWDSREPHERTDYCHTKDVEHGGPGNYIDHLKKDIAQNGMREPIDVRGTNVVTEGHHRGAAAMELKMDKIPVRDIR